MSARKFSCINDHLNSISGCLASENQVIVRRASLAGQVVNEQGEILRMVMKRSEESFHQLTNTIQQLCNTLLAMDNSRMLANQALQELQKEKQKWGELERIIDVRKTRLNAKTSRFKQGKIKRLDTNNIVKQQSKYMAHPQDKHPYMQGKEDKSGLGSFIGGKEGFDLQPKMKLRMQFSKIKQFVECDLAPTLEYREGQQVPKKIMLNIYLAWNRQQHRKCLIEDTRQMQMELTNRLKICFPRISMNRKTFRNIQFRSNYTQHLNLTDRLSDRLPTFTQPRPQANQVNDQLSDEDLNAKKEWLEGSDDDLLMDQ